MENPLATYLADHLAGSVHAIEIVKELAVQRRGEPVGEFATGLLIEIEDDQAVLQGLAERVGTGSNNLKEMAAWLGEKLTRLKLNHEVGNYLGTFQALEFLELGIHGKWALWKVLADVAPGDPRVQNLDFKKLAARASDQRDKVEAQRISIARVAFGNP